MDASSAPASDPNRTAIGASKFLADLPSYGLFSSTVISTNLGGMRVYITDQETSPPEDQLIKTDQMNILIRSLVLKQQKAESSTKSAKGVAANEGSRKRPAERALDVRVPSKRAVSNTQNGSRQEASKSRCSENFQSLTVERIRALLKEKGLSLRGKKDELVARLRSANS